MQTVEPLARERGLDVELREALGEDRQETDGVALLRDVTASGANVVACAHGGLAEALVGRGQRKGETFALEAGDGGLRILDVH